MTIHPAEQISTALAHAERATVSHLRDPHFSPLMGHPTTREAPVRRDLDAGGGTPEAAPRA